MSHSTLTKTAVTLASATTTCPADAELIKLNDDLERFRVLQDVDAFLTRVNQQDCLELLLRRIKHWTRGTLDSEQMSDVTQDVLVTVWQMWHQDKILAEFPLRSVFRAAKCRAIDARRRHSTRLRRGSHSDTRSTTIVQDLEDITLPDDPVRAQELDVALKVIVTDHLSPFQQKVFDAYCEIGKDNRSGRYSFATLADRVSTTADGPMTTDRVRSALREALRKVRDELIRQEWVPDKEACTYDRSRTPPRTCRSEEDLSKLGE